MAALLHGWLHASIRPMFQVSDEISYLSGLQQRVYETEPGTRAYVCASPPDGIPLQVDAGGKLLFRQAGGLVLQALCGSGLPSTTVYWLLRLMCGVSLPFVVLLTFLLARDVLPGRPDAGLAAAGLVTFQPLMATVAGGITPDSLVNALGAVVLLLSTRWVLGLAPLWHGALMAAAALLALGTKDTAMFLLPTVAMAAGIRAWSRAQSRAARTALVIGVVLATPVVTGAVLRALPPTTVPGTALPSDLSAWELSVATLTHASDQGWSMLWSTWMPLGNFGASPLQLPEGLLVLPVLYAGLAVLGAAATISQLDHPRLRRVAPLWATGLLLCALQPAVREAVLRVPDAYQGRWLFPMLPVLALLVAMGIPALGLSLHRTLPLWLLLLGTVAGLALLVVAGYYYAEFPSTIDQGRLFLRSSSGVPLDMAKLSLWLDRPRFLRAPLPFVVGGLAWLAATGTAILGAARLPPFPKTPHDRLADHC